MRLLKIDYGCVYRLYLCVIIKGGGVVVPWQKWMITDSPKQTTCHIVLLFVNLFPFFWGGGIRSRCW